MLDAFFQAICRVGTFMICAQAIVHFKPNESYEKYLKLLVSVMILIQLFLPLGSLFVKGDRQETARQLEAFRESLEEGMRYAEEQAAETDRILEQMTLEEVQRRMEEQEAEAGGESIAGVDTADSSGAGGEWPKAADSSGAGGADQEPAVVGAEKAGQKAADSGTFPGDEGNPKQETEIDISVEIQPVEPIVLQEAD